MIDYRDAAPGDLPVVEQIFSATLLDLQKFDHAIKPTARNVRKFSERLFKQALDSGKHGITLAFDAGKCIGGVISVPEDVALDYPEHRAACYAAWVDPDFRKQGVAARLLGLSFDRLKNLGFKEVVSDVSIENVASIRLCRRWSAKTRMLKITFPL